MSHGGGGTIISFGSRASCPKCGRLAPVVDGSYTQNAEGDLVADLYVTPEQAQRLRAAVLWAKQREKRGADPEATARHLEQTIAEAVPEAKSIIDRLRDPAVGNIGAWVAILVSLMMWFTQLESGGISAEDAQRVADETARSVLREQERLERAEPNLIEEDRRGPESPPPATTIPTPRTR